MGDWKGITKISQTTHLPTDTSLITEPVNVNISLGAFVGMVPPPKELKIFELTQEGPGRMGVKDVSFSLNFENICPKGQLLDTATMTCVQTPQSAQKAVSVSCGPGTKLVGTQCMPSMPTATGLTDAKARHSSSICEDGFTLKEFVCSENSSTAS